MKKLVLRIGLLIAALSISLLIGEFAVRLLLPNYVSVRTDRQMWQDHPTYGWITRPGIEVEHGFGETWRVPVRTNSLGFRDEEVTLEKQPGKTRLVVLGDSFAFGYGVKAEERFTEVMESVRDDLDLINLGVSGYSTDQELLVYQDVGRRLSPDTVVLVFATNDIAQNAQTLGYGVPKPVFVQRDGELVLTNVPVPRSRWILRTRRALVRRSALFNLLDARYNAFRDRPPASVRGARARNAPARDPRDDVELTRRLLLKLRDEVETTGARFLVLIAVSGSNLDVNPKLKLELGQWCTEVGLACVDTYEDFKATSGRRPEASLFLSDEHHWTAAGNRIVARRLLEELSRRGWIPAE